MASDVQAPAERCSIRLTACIGIMIGVTRGPIYSSLQLSEKKSLAGVLGKKNMSFPRKRESSLFDLLENLWIPAFAGMTTFAKGLFIQLQPLY